MKLQRANSTLLYKQIKKAGMDNSVQGQGSDTQQKRRLVVNSKIFESILLYIRRFLDWLAGFAKLTEEEQEDAGVYLGRLGDE